MPAQPTVEHDDKINYYLKRIARLEQALREIRDVLKLHHDNTRGWKAHEIAFDALSYTPVEQLERVLTIGKRSG